MKNILYLILILFSTTTFSQKWEELGPFYGKNKAKKLMHSMGFVNAILVNPENEDEIIMGTNSSGIWRTTDKGFSWTCVTNKTYLVPGMGVQSFSVNPGNKNQIFACAGNYTYHPDTYGGTVLISNDRGISWKKLKSFDKVFDRNETKKVIHYSAKKIFVLSDRQVFRSVDTGKSWVSVFQLDKKNNYIKNKDQSMVDMEITKNGTIFISSTHQWGSKANIWKSTDLGKTWINLFRNNTFKGSKSKHYLTVKITKPIDDKIYVAATDGKIISLYKSTNQGNTFKIIDILKCNHNTGDAKASKFEMEISPLNTDKLFFGFIEFMSWDEKNKFVRLSPPGNISKEEHDDVRFMEINLRDGKEEIMMGNDGGITLYLPEKKEFTSLNGLFLPTLQIYKIGISQYVEGFRILAGTQDNGTWEYKNYDWSFISGGDGGGSWISEDGKKDLLSMNHIIVNRNGKRRDNYTPYGRYSNWFIDFPVEKNPNNKEILFGSTKNGNAKGARLFIQPMTYKKHGGIEIKGLNRVGEIGLSELDKNLIFIAEGEPLDKNTNTPRLLKSIDYGVNFIDLTDSKVYCEYYYSSEGIEGYYIYDTSSLREILNYKIITDIEIDPLDKEIIYISLSGFPNVWAKLHQKHRLLVSKDGGITWRAEAHILPEIPINKLVRDKRCKYKMYLATDNGVYTNNEKYPNSWHKLNIGFPKNIAVSDLKINYCTKTLYASTFGRGVWELELKKPEKFTEDKIKKDTKIDKPKFQVRTIRVKRKKTLTITAEINMAKGTKIILEPKATLVIDSALVTSKCNGGWDGIEIEEKRFLWIFKRKKGKVILKNGGKIE